jgi:hypothetical protein
LISSSKIYPALVTNLIAKNLSDGEIVVGCVVDHLTSSVGSVARAVGSVEY